MSLAHSISLHQLMRHSLKAPVLAKDVKFARGETSGIAPPYTVSPVRLLVGRVGEWLSYARMVELADTQDLGSCAAMRAGSTPVTGTILADIVFNG